MLSWYRQIPYIAFGGYMEFLVHVHGEPGWRNASVSEQRKLCNICFSCDIMSQNMEYWTSQRRRWYASPLSSELV